MKRVIYVILLAFLVMTVAGCEMSVKNPFNIQQSDPFVEACREAAQRLIDAGNYEDAAEVLKEGITQTGSKELEQMLNEVNEILENAEAAEQPTQVTTEPPEVMHTEPPATEPPTEPVATQPPASQSTPVSLSGIQRRINVFLSNFSETFFDSYPCTKYEMVSFAYSHARINNDGKVYYDSWEYYISETDVNNILNKYFGITYSQNGAEDVLSYTTQYGTQTIRYDGDYYYFPAADGGFNGYLSIATEMMRNSDGTYTVKYDVYSLAEMWEDDTNNYYNYTAEQARNSIKLDYCYSGVAIVKDYTRSDGNQSYHLLEMSRS